MARIIEVVAHRARWQPMFEVDAAALRVVFGDRVREAHHLAEQCMGAMTMTEYRDFVPRNRTADAVAQRTPNAFQLIYYSLCSTTQRWTP